MSSLQQPKSALRSTSPLGEALQLPCGATLPNRIAKAAMSEQLADRDGAPTDSLVRLYERWSDGGAGLLITGNVMIDGAHLGEAGNVVVTDDRHLGALSAWANAARRRGTHLWMQLNHPGRQTPRVLDAHPVAPSAVPLSVGAGAFALPRALRDDEIRDIVDRFARTAGIARSAGFSGVQIHAAHGYLISQFLSPAANLRHDPWGGDAARRRRFLIEIVRAVRRTVGPAFPLSVKVNSADFQRGGFAETEALEVVEALGDERVDLLEISGGTYEAAAMFGPEPSASTRAREAYFLRFAEQVRGVSKLPLLLTGGFRTRAAMEQALSSRAVDVVGLARPLAVEPGLPAALLEGRSMGAAPVSVHTPWRVADSMVVGAWYQHQIRRMGRGLEPRPSLTRAGALVRYAVDHVAHRCR